MAEKKAPFFSHDSNARNDRKILNLRIAHGAAGYGIYFMLIERLRDEAEYMSVTDYNAIAFDLRVDAKIIKSVVEDFGLFAFTDDGKCFYSESLNRRMDKMDEVSEARSKAGQKGAAQRWGAKKSAKSNEKIANAINQDGKAMAKLSEKIAINETKETKQKESKPPVLGAAEISGKTVFRSYMENINPTPSTSIVDAVNSWIEDGVEEEMMILAIEDAAANNARNWKYINAIIKNCVNDGVRTAEQYRARQEQWSRMRKSKHEDAIGNFAQRKYSNEELDSLVYVPGMEAPNETNT